MAGPIRHVEGLDRALARATEKRISLQSIASGPNPRGERRFRVIEGGQV
jgi:hypothetical protein